MIKTDIQYQVPIVIDRAASGEDSTGPVVFTISDESVDSHQTRFKIDGWNLAYAKRNPVVTYGHPELDSTDDTLYIGRHNVFIQDGKLKASVEFNPDNPRAVRIEKAVRNGFLHMASIRATIEDADFVKEGGKEILEFRAQTLFDFGIVPPGSNKNAFAEKRDVIARSLRPDEDSPVEEPNTDAITKEVKDELSSLSQRSKGIINKLKKNHNG